MIKAVVIDDDELCRDTLRIGLSSYDDITVHAFCKDAGEGLKAIDNYRPDLVFLDVEMPGCSGFQMLQQIQKPQFDVIFTTAYEKHALNAIKASALDFLLKPVGEEDLFNAVQKHRSNGIVERNNKQYEVLMQHYTGMAAQERSLALPIISGFEIIKIKDIVRLSAERNYTEFHMADSKKLLVSKTMKDYESVLTSCQFCRIHHSHIINMNYLKKYTKGDGGMVTLTDGSEIEVSRQRKDHFLEMLNR
jgi:two-component system LytT family response regulator